MVLKPYNLIDTLGVLTLACRQVVGEPAVIAEEPAAVVEEPVLPVEDPAGAAQKSIEELFNKAYTKDPIPNDVLEQLYKGQTRSKQISLAE